MLKFDPLVHGTSIAMFQINVGSKLVSDIVHGFLSNRMCEGLTTVYR